jgi:hypothetical protein
MMDQKKAEVTVAAAVVGVVVVVVHSSWVIPFIAYTVVFI